MTTTAAASTLFRPTLPSIFHKTALNFPKYPSKPLNTRKSSKLSASSARTARTSSSSAPPTDQEQIYFDGGAHYGDLLSNLLLGFTLLWLPLTLAAVSRALYLRYRFTNKRVTVISGFTGQDRSDFPYEAIKDVKVVPRFIGEWGDVVITLKDGTVVDLRSVPRFREIADYCLSMKKGFEELGGRGRRS
ncbi:hypothetical protein LUZ60_005776 [Juncus effusus]|nr:hypothetical protein LUZ60_005776 [Juncus effusus]